MTDQGILIAVLAVGLGAASCFAGQRLFGLLLATAGLAASFAIGSSVAPVLLGEPAQPLVVLGVGALGGVVGMVLVRAFFNAAVLLAFAAIGGWLGAAAATAIGAPHLALPAVAIGGIVASVSAAILQAPRWLVVGVTSVAGAAAIVVAGSAAVGRLDTEPLATAISSSIATVDPAQPLPVLLFSIVGGRWLDALVRPVELVAAQPVLLATIGLLAVTGVLVQATTSGLLPRPRVTRNA